MCAVSMISDHWRGQWPEPIKPTSGLFITQSHWDEYQELKRKAVEYDKRTGQPDCVKPDVDEWEKKIEEFLKKKGLI